MLAARRRLACSVCTRRKVKCDKEIPCNNCVKRGAPSECERDTTGGGAGQSLGGPMGQADDDESVINLRRRIAELESALHQRETSSSPHPAQSPNQSVNRSQSPESEVEEAATVLEFLAWGRVKDPDKSKVPVDAWTNNGIAEENAENHSEVDVDTYLETSKLSSLQLLLPERQQLTQIIEYHHECLLWFHDSYLAPSFRKQLDRFYQLHRGNVESPGVNIQWLALLFSVMAGTMTSAPDLEMSTWGFGESEARLLAQKWYKAVITCLNMADYAANHSIYSVQAIATLTGTAFLLGYSNSQSVLLASASRIAQSLGLHRLDGNARGSEVELETKRRLWEQLCTQDWFSTSFSDTYSIQALHSTSLAPKNCHDDDLRELPESIPTASSFCRYLAKVAAIMPRLQDGIASSNTLYTKYEQVLLYDRRMRALATEGRPAFLTNIPLDPSWPRYIPWSRRALTMSSAHKIIMIHRKFLGFSFTNPAFAFTRRTCIAASKTILNEYKAVAAEADHCPTFWTHEAFSVAACIIVCLELLYQKSPNQETDALSHLVKDTIDILCLGKKRSMIARRGEIVLKALQRQIDEKKDYASGDQEGWKATSRIPGQSNPRKRKQSFDVSGFVRSLRKNPATRNFNVARGSDAENSSEPMEQRYDQTASDPTQQVLETPGTVESSSSDYDEQTQAPVDFGLMLDMSMMDFNAFQSFDNLWLPGDLGT